MNRIIPIIALLFCLLLPATALADVLADDWMDATLEELYTAQTALAEQVARLEAEALAAKANIDAWVPGDPEFVVYEDANVRITWYGLADTHTSGMDFQPDLLLENLSQDMDISIDPDYFYVNNYLMSVSNSGSITLDPGTNLRVSTRYSWLIPAGDLLDCYGCDRIEDFEMLYTIRDNDGNSLSEQQTLRIATGIDIFSLMGENSYFTRQYPSRKDIKPLDVAALPVVFESEEILVAWCGFTDSHTSGMDFQPDVYVQNKSADRTLTVDPNSFYINGHPMSASNSGGITLRGGSAARLSTWYSWLIPSADLLDVYGETVIHDFRMYYSIYDEDYKYIIDDAVFRLQPEADVFQIMGTNSYFTRNYPDRSAIQPLDVSSMQVLYEDEEIQVLWNGLVDTHTSGMDFQPDLYIRNKSTKHKLSLSPERIIINGVPMSVSNSGAVTLEPETSFRLCTCYSWLIPSGDLLDAYGETVVRDFLLIYSIYDENYRYLVRDGEFRLATDIDLFEVMGTNSYFTQNYPDRRAIQAPDYSTLPVIYSNDELTVYWNGLADTHTSGMDFQPALILQNASDNRSFSLSLDNIYINNHKMSVSNSGSISMLPQTRLNLTTRYSWLISSADLIDSYGESTITSIKMYYSIYDGNGKAVASDQLFEIEPNIDLYTLMGGNSYFTRKYPQE